MAEPGPDPAADRLAAALGGLDDEQLPTGRRAERVARAALPVISARARRAGARAMMTGGPLVDLLVDVAERLPVRDRTALRRQYGDLPPGLLADRLVATASNLTGALGAASGMLISAEQLLPPAWPSVPVELTVEAVLVSCVELKLVGELHAVYGRAIPTQLPARAAMLLRSWATGRGVSVSPSFQLADVLAPAARRQVTKRLLGRLGRGSTGVLPALVGGVVAGTLNRRATRRLAADLRSDLCR